MSQGWIPPGEVPGGGGPQQPYGAPVPGAEPYGAPVPGAVPPGQPGPGYGNWGLAYPPGAAYAPVFLVPRPPRPAVVTTAVILTFAGTALSAVSQIIGIVVTLANRDQIASDAAGRVASDPNAPDISGIIRTTTTLGLVAGALFWLVPAAGAVVTGIMARRGNNPARIILASMMGVFALSSLCSGVSGVVGMGMLGVSTGIPTGWRVVSGVIEFALTAVAVAIGILLLLPASTRYFSPGPGRRFVPAGDSPLAPVAPPAPTPVPPGAFPGAYGPVGGPTGPVGGPVRPAAFPGAPGPGTGATSPWSAQAQPGGGPQWSGAPDQGAASAVPAVPSEGSAGPQGVPGTPSGGSAGPQGVPDTPGGSEPSLWSGPAQ